MYMTLTGLFQFLLTSFGFDNQVPNPIDGIKVNGYFCEAVVDSL